MRPFFVVLATTGFSTGWGKEKKRICTEFFGAVLGTDEEQRDRLKRALATMVEEILDEISRSEQGYGFLPGRGGR